MKMITGGNISEDHRFFYHPLIDNREHGLLNLQGEENVFFGGQKKIEKQSSGFGNGKSILAAEDGYELMKCSFELMTNSSSP